MSGKDSQADLPANVTALGRALRPTLAKVSTTLASSPLTGGETATVELVEEYLSRLANAHDDFLAKVEEIGQVIAEDDELAVYRAVGAFDAHLQVLLDGYMEVRSWGGNKRARQGRDLLAQVHRSILTQIKGWLQEVVDVAEAPLAVAERGGLKPAEDERVSLEVTLAIQEPPELELLIEWKQDAEPETPERDGIGFWGRVASIMLGIGIADLLFFDD